MLHFFHQTLDKRVQEEPKLTMMVEKRKNVLAGEMDVKHSMCEIVTFSFNLVCL